MIGKDTITTHINQDIGHFCAFDNVNIFLHSSKVALFVLVYHSLRVALFNMMSCEVLCFNKAPACEFQDRPQQNQGCFFFLIKSAPKYVVAVDRYRVSFFTSCPPCFYEWALLFCLELFKQPGSLSSELQGSNSFDLFSAEIISVCYHGAPSHF